MYCITKFTMTKKLKCNSMCEVQVTEQTEITSHNLRYFFLIIE